MKGVVVRCEGWREKVPGRLLANIWGAVDRPGRSGRFYHASCDRRIDISRFRLIIDQPHISLGMKKRHRLYWVIKVFISVFMFFSAYYLYVHAEAFRQLGFPDYFRIELVIAKIAGALLLLVPVVSLRVKEWIYAGFGMTMLSALFSHIYNHDPLTKIIFVAVGFLLVALSIHYVTKIEYRLDTPT